MLRELIKDHDERVMAVAEIQVEVKELEDRIVDTLIKNSMYEMFNVNWRKLRRAIRDKKV